mmetsp:Transcript_65547/g.184591  ORF Transcript_65547/g.184591 Transcript_65547/m.184591 type:complete len:211 (-) Transcript_65547:32-664(-)
MDKMRPCRTTPLIALLAACAARAAATGARAGDPPLSMPEGVDPLTRYLVKEINEMEAQAATLTAEKEKLTDTLHKNQNGLASEMQTLQESSISNQQDLQVCRTDVQGAKDSLVQLKIEASRLTKDNVRLRGKRAWSAFNPNILRHGVVPAGAPHPVAGGIRNGPTYKTPPLPMFPRAGVPQSSQPGGPFAVHIPFRGSPTFKTPPGPRIR